MADTNDVVEITVEYEFEDKKAENVYKYINLGVGVSVGNILWGFELNALPQFLNTITEKAEVTKLRGRNLFNPSEGEERVIGQVGNRAAGEDSFPTFVAIDYDLFHDDATVKTGKKRLGGLVENMTDDGKFPTVAYQGHVDNMATAMEDSWTVPPLNLGDMYPVVPGYILVVEGEYRLPESFLEMSGRGYGLVTGVSGGKVTTQNSRKD